MTFPRRAGWSRHVSEVQPPVAESLSSAADGLEASPAREPTIEERFRLAQGVQEPVKSLFRYPMP